MRTFLCSYDFEVTLQFPIGYTVEPLPPFPFAGGGEVVDEVVTEPIARGLRIFEDARGLDQRARCARNVLRALVGAGDGPGGELEVLLDTVQPGGEDRGHREIRIHVRARAARFQTRRLRRAGDHPEARRAIVDTPRRLHRRPETVDQPLVAVDGRPEHGRELHGDVELPGEIALEELAHAMRA